MYIKYFLLHVLHFTTISHSLLLNNSSLLKLVNITEFKLEDLGFANTDIDIDSENCERVTNPFLVFQSGTSERIVKEDNAKYSSFPKFQEIYSNCHREFMKNSTCLATCIFYGIISEAEFYGYLFIVHIKTGDNLHSDPSTPFPHLVGHEFHRDPNIFCFSKKYRHILINNIATCNLLSKKEFCIIDEDALHCDDHLQNCDFDETEASVITSGNKAHVVTCGTLDAIKWKYFERSTKFQCVLPGRKSLLDAQRPVFKDCHVCADAKDGKSDAVIEYTIVPTKDEFAKDVYSARPIIIRNGTAFEGIPPLNFSKLKEIYKNIGNWKPCKLRTYNISFDNFSHAISKLNDEVLKDIYYLRWGVCNRKIRTRFGSLIKSRLSFLPDDYPRVIGAPWVIVTAAGDGVNPHYDYFRDMTWQAQLSGSKRWKLGSPPECNHICTELFEVTVSQGDFILMYTNTWLHGLTVEDGDPSIVIALEYEAKDERQLNPKF